MDQICNGCGGSGQNGMGSDSNWSCSGCGGSGRMQTMQPCPSCGGSGEQGDGGGPIYAPPSAPLTRAQRVKSRLISLIVFGGLAAYVYHTTR
ncbi:hypothetical protein [Embleya sp. NPDC005971]|uniref:hypothetical protein n=1 Tax=unclassified Embleya TaxID=2699296 RepID=UPI0033FF6BFC